ncbi:MAG: PAS domain-containing protein, partial [Planctomycetota bacterium]
MRSAPTPIYEQQRLDALRRYGVLDSLPEQVYDDVVQLAAQICGMPIAMISLVDTDRQWFKAKLGVDQPGTPRDIAFCAHAILERDVFVVPNAAVDERFHDNPLVTGSPGIQFYAGAPIVTPDGFAIGAVCVNDRMPRQLNEGQLQALQSLARQVVGHLELRRELAAREGLLRELVTARERHDLVVRASREGIWDCDYVTDVTIVSPRGCEIFDLEAGPFRSSLFDWLSRVHPDDLDATRAAFDAHIREESAYDIEFRWRLRDGSYRWVHVRGLAVHGPNGQIARLAGSVSDIEDKKRDELALRRLSHLLEELQRLAAVGGWELDLATNELFWTDETYRLHETSPSEYRPTVESAIAFYQQDSLPRIARLVEDAKTTGTPYAAELRLRTATGRHIWVQTTGKCVFENGRPVRLVGTFQDITDRRRAADELRCAVEAA